MNDTETFEFFAAQALAFAETLANRRGRENLIDGLLSQAFSSFEGNTALMAEDYPALACHKGCAPCCTLRVTATAPEVLLIARYIAWAKFTDTEINLSKRVAKANQQTCGLNEAQRVKLRRRCPFIMQGACVIYPVRPLACRGHASHDARACIDAAAGRLEQIPASEPHRLFRGLIQNALQSALRDAGYAWGLYELNQALHLALNDASFLARWIAGEDVLAPAGVTEVSREEMGLVFDQIKLRCVSDSNRTSGSPH
ncbi:MAG: YkgJ family cysteine cluster protein [Methylomonas sp.]|jgi:Fe-S-cluster containining protein